MMCFEVDKEWGRLFLPEMKRIISEHLICEAPLEEDQKRNTDLIVLRMEALRIACRVRRQKYYWQYSHQFTIRLSRPSNAKTELTKIIEGWGHYFLYGFGHDGFGHDRKLTAWTLADLSVFRVWYNQQLYRGMRPGERRSNKDKSSELIAFNWFDLPPEFIVASHHRCDYTEEVFA
jgi:hypothetical protein